MAPRIANNTAVVPTTVITPDSHHILGIFLYHGLAGGGTQTDSRFWELELLGCRMGDSISFALASPAPSVPAIGKAGAARRPGS